MCELSCINTIRGFGADVDLCHWMFKQVSGFRFQVYNSLPCVYMLIGCVRCRERNKWIERTVLMRKGKR